tara:strand:+ start:858 stop:1295 length:438 start_codon:yes stop_codon:yes gene_type:complete
MATFVELDSNNIVLRGIAIHNNECLENGVESEARGIQFCQSLYGPNTIWKQTSYNTRSGIYYNSDGTVSDDQSKAFRKNHASTGFSYDADRDAFINPKKCENLVFNEDHCLWELPPMPTEVLDENSRYEFDFESNGGEWVIILVD